MNIYERMRMQSLTAHGVAAAVFGARAPSAPPPSVPNVMALFTRGSLARSVINAPEDMNYVLGSGSGNLQGFGGATKAKFSVIADIGFNEQWSYDDWTGSSGWNDHITFWDNIGATYEPVSNAVLQRARDKWVSLKVAADAGSVEAENLMLRLRTELGAACDYVDSNTKAGDDLGRRSNGSHVERANALTNVNGVIKSIANVTVPRVPLEMEEEVFPSGGGGGGSGTMTSSGQTTTGSSSSGTSSSGGGADPYAIVAQQQRDAAARASMQKQLDDQKAALLLAQAKADAMTAEGDDNGLPGWVAPAAVGVVFIGAAAFLMRGKKKR